MQLTLQSSRPTVQLTSWKKKKERKHKSGEKNCLNSSLYQLSLADRNDYFWTVRQCLRKQSLSSSYPSISDCSSAWMPDWLWCCHKESLAQWLIAIKIDNGWACQTVYANRNFNIIQIQWKSQQSKAIDNNNRWVDHRKFMKAWAHWEVSGWLFIASYRLFTYASYWSYCYYLSLLFID